VIEDKVLVNDWHAVAKSHDVTDRRPIKARLLEEDIVLWRANGNVLAWKDLCMHRGTRLSIGSVENDKLVCAYHGWTYDKTGKCVNIPAHPEQVPPEKACVTTYRSVEDYGLVWVSLGSPKIGLPPFPEWEKETCENSLRAL
jgi:phenylpropionate dioxygenase-like ring-hydroxylating dioxygenase large terminal subunit